MGRSRGGGQQPPPQAVLKWPGRGVSAAAQDQQAALPRQQAARWREAQGCCVACGRMCRFEGEADARNGA